MSAVLTADQLRRDLALRDLTDPTQGPHAIQQVIHRAVAALANLWNCEVRWWRGDRIVSIRDNYDNLGFDRADITRDARYTRYVDAHRMLRSHSSAMIPRPCGHWSPIRPPTYWWSAPAWCIAATRSIGCIPQLRTSSTCGASPAGHLR